MEKKCKYCGITENLRKDKKGKIYSYCEECYHKYSLACNKKIKADSYKEQIIDLYTNQNKTAKEISIIINISKDQIWDALKRWGVKAKTKGERAKVNLTEKQKDQLIQLVNNGFSINLIAEKMGLTKDIIYERAKELNLKFISEYRSFNNIECVYCKKEFKPTSARNIFCSEECLNNHREKSKEGNFMFCPFCQKIIGEKYLLHHKNNHQDIEIKEYLSKLFNIPKKKCDNPHCNNLTNFIQGKFKFAKYCSIKCRNTDPKMIEHCKKLLTGVKLNKEEKERIKNIKQQNSIKKYGVLHPLQHPELKKKLSQRIAEGFKKMDKQKFKEFHKKQAQSLSISRNNENKEKIKQRVESFKNNFIKKYGVENPMHIKEITKIISKKVKQDWAKGIHDMSEQEKVIIAEKIKQSWNKKTEEDIKIIQQKTYESKKKNNSFNISSQEKRIFEFLKQYFPNIISQYKSELYPFLCDFYIPDLDLYIEYNGIWAHGVEPFNEKNQKHIDLVNEWIMRSKEINFKNKNKQAYMNAVNMWTKLDPEKRETAKNNNIKYLEIWFSDYKKGLNYILDKINNFVK